MPADEYLQAVLLGRDTLGRRGQRGGARPACRRPFRRPPAQHDGAHHLHRRQHHPSPCSAPPSRWRRASIWPSTPRSPTAPTRGRRGAASCSSTSTPRCSSACFPTRCRTGSCISSSTWPMKRRRFLKQAASPQFYDCALYLKEELEQKRPNYRRMCDLYLFQLILLLSRQAGGGDGAGQLAAKPAPDDRRPVHPAALCRKDHRRAGGGILRG